ncbi:hypothetical protein AZE42_12610 [Rhizopogon vesiculosus]|uniref:Uncharacterized protein n=1 Tax=Rhizopogon vesiculosus TaxID=180088 RepID=A0A1J8PSH6_9AGAM|nr:hypothetical protein AZE42_12610 [Rhizopogon vesiculosus]
MRLANLIEIERKLFSCETMNSLEEKVPNKETKLKSFLRNRKRYEKKPYELDPSLRGIMRDS